MRVTDTFQGRSRWVLRAIGWLVALLIIFTLAYRAMFQKRAVRKEACLDLVWTAQPAMTPLAAVEKYSACIAGQSANASPAPAPPARCRYAGVWAAARGNMVYQVTLDANGKFLAEPGHNVPANEQAITGAWGVAGNSLVWAYDSGAVWPPDINPISAESESAFTLTEVNRSTTRYTSIDRLASVSCPK
jgi:hypothetical protein